MSFFKKRGDILSIEINDKAIDKHIAKLVIKGEKTIRDLEETLKVKDFMQKDEDISKLLRIFQEILDEISIMQGDVERIRLREQQEKNYVKVPDEQYLLDKKEQLSKMSRAVQSIVDMLKEHPSVDELKSSVLDELFEKMNKLIDELNSIINDDNNLEDIYKRVNR